MASAKWWRNERSIGERTFGRRTRLGRTGVATFELTAVVAVAGRLGNVPWQEGSWRKGAAFGLAEVERRYSRARSENGFPTDLRPILLLAKSIPQQVRTCHRLAGCLRATFQPGNARLQIQPKH